MTCDLQSMAGWLKECNIEMFAMKSRSDRNQKRKGPKSNTDKVDKATGQLLSLAAEVEKAIQQYAIVDHKIYGKI